MCRDPICLSLVADVGNGQRVNVHCIGEPNNKAKSFWGKSYMSREYRVSVDMPEEFGNKTITLEAVYKPKWWWILLSNSACKVAIVLHLQKLRARGSV